MVSCSGAPDPPPRTFEWIEEGSSKQSSLRFLVTPDLSCQEDESGDMLGLFAMARAGHAENWMGGSLVVNCMWIGGIARHCWVG